MAYGKDLNNKCGTHHEICGVCGTHHEIPLAANVIQTRNAKFLIAPRLNQVSMSMCLKSPVLV